VIEDSADFVIVGTGAGGATAARVLAAAGRSVVMIEEGALLKPEERARGLVDAFAQSARDMATLATSSHAPLPLLQGRCVGGSTAINSGIIWRVPEAVRTELQARYGLSHLLEARALDRIYAQLEDELEVDGVNAQVRGQNAALMERGALALGLPGQPMRRNARRCVGHARCLQGCPEGARQSMDVSYVPRALRDGARLHTGMRAKRIGFSGGRACFVEGVAVDAEGHARERFRMHARAGVIVAAGAVWTPLLLRASGVTRLVGDGFQAHPGVAVVGAFREQVGMGFGVTQAYEVPLLEQRLKLESLSLPPELLAARVPGAGAEWQARLHRLDHMAQWCAITRMEARGRVRNGILGARVRYEPTERDIARVQQGVALIVRMMFAAGAEEVYPGVAGVPEVLSHPDEAALLDARRFRRSDFHLMASHHFATAPAGNDASRSVVGEDLQCHDVKGLYVMDASALPENLGVNPQHTIMAIVFRAAEQLAEARLAA
jgi:choline dehydrogenase-like flavoprotein